MTLKTQTMNFGVEKNMKLLRKIGFAVFNLALKLHCLEILSKTNDPF